MALDSWTQYKLSDLITSNVVAIGDGYRAKNSELCPSKSGLPFARAGNINSGFKFDNADYLAIANIPKAGEKISQSGDVLFTSKGTVGRVAFVSEKTPKFVYSPQLTWWRVKDTKKVEPRFLYYWMHGREFYVQINGLRGQTDMADYVSLRDQRQMMYITLPPLDEQKAIAHILSSLDDKIELNQQMNRTLEGIARALFKSWFIDFDPVRAKLDGRQPAGMDAETAALFPAEFEDGGAIGRIPKGWRVGNLGEIADVVMGASPKGDTYNEEGIGTPLVNGPVEFGDYFLVKRKWTTAPTRLSRKGDLIFCVRGSTTGRRVISDDTYCLGRGVCAIRGLNNTQLFINLLIELELERLLAKTTGSVFPNLSSSDLRGFEVLIPANTVIEKYCSYVQSLIKQIWMNVDQSLTLASVRDCLIPKLLSSEIRVKEAEKIVAEVA